MVDAVVERRDDIRKSAFDRRQYRHLKLNNEMQVLLISDPEADKGAASMDVSVGFASDPDDLPGLAHFLEHMLFLGTEKYPDEASYQQFLSSHGGSSNAYTDFENTNFYFDIMCPHLGEALDRFAQFFTAPLFTESATGRELKAIDSENAKNLQSDTWRMVQLCRWMAQSAHPYHKFGTGNLQTLVDRPESNVSLQLSHAGGGTVAASINPCHRPGRSIRDALFAHHAKHYSANAMRLCVLGKEPLDALQKLVVPLFANVANYQRPKPVWGCVPYTEEQLCRFVRVVPVKNFRSLTVQWPLPPLKPHYRTKPHRYLSHLLGHESEGSLLSFLKEKGWVDALCAGDVHSSSDFSVFSVQVSLSEAGDKHVEEILPAVFQYLRMLQAEPPAEWVYNECRDMGEMSFRFKEREEEQEAVAWLSNSLELYPPDEVMSAAYLFAEFSPREISEMLDLLTPRRAIVIHQSMSVADRCNLTEPWYGTRFSTEPLSETFVGELERAPPEPRLHLPEPNPFIPTDFELECERANLPPERNLDEDSDSDDSFDLDAFAAAHGGGDADGADAEEEEEEEEEEEKEEKPPFKPRLPDLLVDDRGLELWHKTDSTFRRPKTNLMVNIIAPAAYYSPRAACLTTLFIKLVNDELTEFSYHADLAGLHYGVKSTNAGLRLALSGYSHKLPVLLRKVLSKLRSPTLAEERYVVHRENLEREYKNFFKEQPYQHAIYASQHLTQQQRWHILEYLELAGGEDSDQLSLEALRKFVSTELLERASAQVLAHGNCGAAHARALAAELEALGIKALHASERHPQRCLQLPAQAEVWLRQHPRHCSKLQQEHANLDDTNSAIELFLQVGIDERPTTMLLELLAQVLHKKAENQLRTVEQLGYIVWCTVRYDSGVVGLRFIIQSSTHDAAALDARIEAFLDDVPAILKAQTDEEFENNRQALIDIKLEKDKRLRDETYRFWNEVVPHGTYDFQRTDRDAEAIKSLTRDALLAFFHERLARSSPLRRKLSTQIFSGQHELPAPPAHVTCLDTLAAQIEFKRTMFAFPVLSGPKPAVAPSE